MPTITIERETLQIQAVQAWCKVHFEAHAPANVCADLLAALAAQPAEPVAVNEDEVICPNCCAQFRAIPGSIQRLMLDAGFQPPFTAAPAAVPPKLWLWKNFVDGRPEYWAFDNPFPVHMDCGDPQTLGEPVGYALFKPSRSGRDDVSEADVLRRIAASGDKP